MKGNQGHARLVGKYCLRLIEKVRGRGEAKDVRYKRARLTRGLPPPGGS